MAGPSQLRLCGGREIDMQAGLEGGANVDSQRKPWPPSVKSVPLRGHHKSSQSLLNYSEF